MLFASPFIGNSLFVPGTLDPSWRWSLYQAFEHHLQFGTQYLFTYGPLGFIDVPQLGASRGLWLIASLVTLVVQVSLIVLVYKWIAPYLRKRDLSGPDKVGLAALTAFFLIQVIHQPASVLLSTISLLLSMGLLTSIFSSIINRRLIVVNSLVLATASLIKSSGFVYSIMILIFVTAGLVINNPLSRKKRIELGLTPIASYILGILFLWVISRQSIFNLFAFFRGTVQIILGYGEAMQIAGDSYQVVIAAVLIISFLIMCAFFVFRTMRSVPGSDQETPERSASWVTRLWPVLIAISYLALNWKEGIVRQDITFSNGHSGYVFLGIAVALMVLLLLDAKRIMSHVASLSVLIVAILSMAIFATQAIDTTSPTLNLQETATAIGSVSSSKLYSQYVSQEYTALRSTYKIPAGILSAVGNKKVVILPYSLTLGSAYGLNEVLLPVSQLYSAYTPYLDHLDSSFLASNRVPYVLMRYQGLDGRYALWSAPQTYKYLLTNYRVVDKTAGFALLKLHRSMVSTSQRTMEIGRIGSWTSVPTCVTGTPVVSVALHPSLIEQLKGLLFRQDTATVAMKVGTHSATTNRFIWSVASGPLNLNGYVTSPSQIVPIGSPNKLAPAISAIKISAPSSMFSTNTPHFRFACEAISG